MDRIVDILRGNDDTTRADIQKIVDETGNKLTTFALLLIKEEEKQAQEKKDKEEGETLTGSVDQQCN